MTYPQPEQEFESLQSLVAPGEHGRFTEPRPLEAFFVGKGPLTHYVLLTLAKDKLSGEVYNTNDETFSGARLMKPISELGGVPCSNEVVVVLHENFAPNPIEEY